MNELPYSSLTEISAVNMMGLRTCTLLVEVGIFFVCESEGESERCCKNMFFCGKLTMAWPGSSVHGLDRPLEIYMLVQVQVYKK